MDRSFLSLKPIIDASRRFVCIRNLTYEDAEERDFQRSLFIGRSGDIENTTFCVLAPDGKRKITRAGRSIREVFQSPEQMAKWMNQAADFYDNKRKQAGLAPEPITALPLVPTVRLAINTAEADHTPLVVLYGSTEAEVSRLQASAAALAWTPEFAGRFAYTTTTQGKDLSVLETGTPKPGFVVIQSTKYGQAGRVLARAEPDATPEQLANALRQGLQGYQPRRLNPFEYLRAGHQAGAFWDTKLPVTDVEEAQAREQFRPQAPSPQR